MRIFPRHARMAITLLTMLMFEPLAQAAQLLPPIIAITAGGGSFLRADGSVWAFTDATYLTSPVRVPGLKDIIEVVGSDGATSYALRRDGSVWSWTARCRVSEDEAVCRYGQVRQIRGIAEVIHLAAGRAYAIGLKRDGTVWGWGDNAVGQLGDTADDLKFGIAQRDLREKDHPITVLPPIQIPVLKDIVRISADLDHAIALDRTGQAWTWGSNASGIVSVGTLGEGEFVSQAGAGVIKLTGLPPSSDVAAGSSRMAVVGRDGKIRAWGIYEDSVVRYGDMKVGEIAGADRPRRITASQGAVFWIGDDGTAWQQGPGMFGYGKDEPGKARRVGVDTPVSEISAGDFKVSVLTANGQIWTWGSYFGDIAGPTLVMAH